MAAKNSSVGKRRLRTVSISSMKMTRRPGGWGLGGGGGFKRGGLPTRARGEDTENRPGHQSWEVLRARGALEVGGGVGAQGPAGEKEAPPAAAHLTPPAATYSMSYAKYCSNHLPS